MNTINQLKECLKSMQTKNVVHPRENSMNFRETNCKSQSNFTENFSLTCTNKENEAQNDQNKARNSMKKSPVENLQGYYNNLRSNKNSRTRNSNIQGAVSVNNIPKGTKTSIKRCHTSLNGSDSYSFIKSIDEIKSYDHHTIDNRQQTQSKHNEDVSPSSRYINKFKVNKCERNNSTYMEMESESEKEQTPVKSKIVNLQTKTKEK